MSNRGGAGSQGRISFEIGRYLIPAKSLLEPIARQITRFAQAIEAPAHPYPQ